MSMFFDLILRVLLCNLLLKYLLGLPDKLVHLNRYVIRYLKDMLMWLMIMASWSQVEQFFEQVPGRTISLDA